MVPTTFTSASKSGAAPRWGRRPAPRGGSTRPAPPPRTGRRARRADVELDEPSCGVDVLALARAQVVDDDDLVTPGDEGVDEIGADESGSAGDDCPHVGSYPRSRVGSIRRDRGHRRVGKGNPGRSAGPGGGAPRPVREPVQLPALRRQPVQRRRSATTSTVSSAPSTRCMQSWPASSTRATASMLDPCSSRRSPRTISSSATGTSRRTSRTRAPSWPGNERETARSVGSQRSSSASSVFPRPDLVLLLDLPPAMAQSLVERKSARPTRRWRRTSTKARASTSPWRATSISIWPGATRIGGVSSPCCDDLGRLARAGGDRGRGVGSGSRAGRDELRPADRAGPGQAPAHVRAP